LPIKSVCLSRLIMGRINIEVVIYLKKILLTSKV